MKTETGFLDRSAKLGDTVYKFQVYVPDSYTPDRRWPVILFLHGAGETGEDGLLQTEVGIGTAIRRHRDRFPCIVVMPQCRPGHSWTDAMEVQALQALAEEAYTFNGDRDRIYLTGLSLGGFGVWPLAMRHPGRFAAVVPVCGWVTQPEDDIPPSETALYNKGNPVAGHPSPFTAAARLVGSIPTWVFHGDNDQAVSVEQSRNMVDAMKAAGGNVHYTEYEGMGHNVWDRAYGDSALMSWLLEQ